MKIQATGMTMAMAGTEWGDGQPQPTGEVVQLVRQAKAGDMSAFEQVIIHHERQVLMTALRLLGSLDDAQDAAQEVFLRFHKYLRSFDETRDVSPWLYQVTVNVCRRLGRKRQGTAMLSLEDLRERGELDEVADSTNLELDLALDEKKRVAVEGLKRLPEKERAALVLRDVEGLSTKEVARILGSSEATVRSQISVARLKMRKFLARFLGRKS